MQGRKKLRSLLPSAGVHPELSLEPIVLCLGESSSSSALEPNVTCVGEPNSRAYLETKVNGIDPTAVNSLAESSSPHQHRQLGSAAYLPQWFPPHCRGHFQHPHLRQLRRPGVVHAAGLCPERLRC
ncbi:BQ5605_C024g09895 [Microbotryum silenes-dioicae]|uniref:BQ5605_C024g09895 protein n=1 Tax=Microbotryum silenes-dioicae TaxID=796604 RepID=A0A2X0MLZ4_9BASI|nr:BQ5605_C024g09895 [Microbotryum silenes-dioicae]